VIVNEGGSADGYSVIKIDASGVDVTTPDGTSIRLPFSNPESEIPEPQPR
jgi:hypothetical protein